MGINKQFFKSFFICLFGLFTTWSCFASVSQLEDLIRNNYSDKPATLIEQLESIDEQELNSLSNDVLVKASYASANVANVELTLHLTEVLLTRARKAKDDILEGQAHYNRGAAYAQSGNHNLALDSLLAALLSFENTDSDRDIARIKGGLALIYVEIGEYELAKPYFEESLNSHYARNDKLNISMVLQNQGFMKIKQGKYASAKDDLLNALSLAVELNQQSFYPTLYKNLGKIETELGNFKQATGYFEKAISESETSQLEQSRSEILREYALLQFKLGDLENARTKLNQSFVIAKKYDLIKQLRNNYFLLSKIEAAQENYEAAYLAREKELETAEAMGESSIASNLSRLERYTTRLKEQNKRVVLEQENKIAILAAEREQLMKNFSMAIAAFAIILVVYFFRRFSHTNRQAVHFEKQSKIDPLTGIWNRRAGEAQLSRLCSRDSNSVNVFSIAMLDIDHFKKINDKFGHDTGDKVIVEICNLIQETLRPSDMLCRWGGEEFIIIWDNFNVDKAFDVCERIRQKIAASSIKSIGNLTVSIGIAMYQNDDIYELLKRGDQAMYDAKHRGRNQVVVNEKSIIDIADGNPAVSEN